MGCPPAAEASLSAEEMASVSRRLELSNEANPDFNSAVTASAALSMGLYAREMSGEGLELETRMMLSNAMMMSADFIDYPGRPPHREVDSELNGLGPLYRLYRAAEGWVFLAAPQARDFERLCTALGIPEVASDERFATAESRSRHGEALSEALGAAIAKRNASDLERELSDQGVACMRADEGPYRSWLFEQSWAREDGVVVDIEESQDGAYRRYGAPLTNGRPVALRGAFAAGRETRALLAEVGYSDTEIEKFLASGVVGEAAGD
jgi:crotonobetainyl-CoA:carnitine CoA-transferase CaiB-like acyl-CoA transferase